MATTASGRRPEPRHGLRIFLIWIILALAADLVIWFVWYPHMPPGRMSNSAKHQQFDIAVLAISAAPVIIFVVLYFVYSLVVWRARPGDDSDGEPIYGNIKVQASLDHRHHGHRAVVVRVRHRRARRAARRGRRRGPVAHLEAGRNAVGHLDSRRQQDTAGTGDRPAVDLDVPVSRSSAGWKAPS